MAIAELWPRITTSELAEACQDHNSYPERCICPMGWFECPFTNGKYCANITTEDWEEYLDGNVSSYS